MKNIIYQKVKELCDSKNLSITELERILQYGNGTIHRWSTANPTIEKLKQVADYFKVWVDYFISDSYPTQESLEIAKEFEDLSSNQKRLVKCYISIIKVGQV
ncbi:MAG: helix-turn-helix transcriptional regulator [Mobilitalea sp.]